jgi:anti-sigma factor ChrR (cupin superfamily)
MVTAMNCRTIQSWMVEYADGLLDARRARLMATHLAGCEECARLTQEIAATGNLLRTLPPLQVSPDFEARLAARLSQCPPKAAPGWWTRLTPSAPRLLRPALALGAATFAVAGALFLHPWVQTPPATVPSDDYTSLISQSVALHQRDVAAQPLTGPAAADVAGIHSSWQPGMPLGSEMPGNF